MKNKLHPGVKWCWRFTGYLILILLFGFTGIWMVGPLVFMVFLLPFIAEANLGASMFLFIAVPIFILTVIIVLIEIYVRMAYDRWFYEFTQDGLRLERGVIWKRYSNVPYERIQNVDIHRGIIARMLGFSSLLIQTAGYSAQPHSEGYIPALGVEEAEHLREFVLKRITKGR